MIPKSVRVFIDKIPENCARKCLWDAHHEYTQDGDKQFIGKINGRLEFMVQANNLIVHSIFMWDFEDEPKEWHNHFDDEDIPLIDMEVLEEVFV